MAYYSPLSLLLYQISQLKERNGKTMKQDKIEDALVAMYDAQGILQALRDELEPITNKINSNHPLDQQQRILVLTESVRNTDSINALLNVLGKLQGQTLNCLEQLDNSKEESEKG